MQGRDPDRDDGAPGEDPAPDYGHASPAPFGYANFPVPDNPYDEPGDPSGPSDSDATDGSAGHREDRATETGPVTGGSPESAPGPSHSPAHPSPSGSDPPKEPEAPGEPGQAAERESTRGPFEPRHQVGDQSEHPSPRSDDGGRSEQDPGAQASGQPYESGPPQGEPATREAHGHDAPHGESQAPAAPTEMFGLASGGPAQPQESPPRPPGETEEETDAELDRDTGAEPESPPSPAQEPPADRATEQFRDVQGAAETSTGTPAHVASASSDERQPPPDEAQSPAPAEEHSPAAASGAGQPSAQPATEWFGRARRDDSADSESEPGGGSASESAREGIETGQGAEHTPETGRAPSTPEPDTQRLGTVGATAPSPSAPQPQPGTHAPAETAAETTADGAEDPPALPSDGPGTGSPADAATDHPGDSPIDSPADSAAASPAGSPDPPASSAEPATDSLRLAGREPGQQPPGAFDGAESAPHPPGRPASDHGQAAPPHGPNAPPTTTWQTPEPQGSAPPPSQGAGAYSHGHGRTGSGSGFPPPANAAARTPELSHDVADLHQYPPKRRRGLLIASLILVAVLAVGGAALAYTSFFSGGGLGQPFAGASTPAASHAGQPSAHAPRNAAPSFDPRKVNDASTDPRPLTLEEAFPEQRVSVDGRTFRRVNTAMSKKCGQAAQEGFAGALRQADCTRVLRATYVDGTGKYAVTTGIAVLPNAAGATDVEEAANPGENVWFAALPGPQGSGTERIHRSGGYSALEVVGRYAIFSFAAYSDRITPPPQSSDLSDVCASLRDHTAKPILERGIVTPGVRQ